MIIVISLLSQLAWTLYLGSAFVLGRAKDHDSDWPNTIFMVTKYPAFASIFIGPAKTILADHRAPSVWQLFIVLLQLLFWWLNRNAGDDDRWNRTKKRLSERVQEVGGRLVVVPA